MDMRIVLFRYAGAMSLAFAGLFTLVAPAHSADVEPENVLQAAYIRILCENTRWPAGAVRETLSIGLVGRDRNKVGKIIKESIATKRYSVDGQPIELSTIKTVDTVEDAGGDLQLTAASAAGVQACNVLFLMDVPDDQVQAVLKAVGSRPILIVSNRKGLIDQGVPVELIRIRRNMKLRICYEDVKRRSLTMSSEMLDLGRASNGKVELVVQRKDEQ